LHLFADRSKVYVANIVPTDRSNLSIGEYNEALVEFYERFAHPAADSIGVDTVLSADLVDLEVELPKHVFQALTAFSSLANKATGSSHPLDRQRWFEFLTLLHGSNSDLSTGLLQDWLILDGWSESVAFDLVIEFEFGIGLLKHVDRH
jgi:hypothetical protein